MTPDAIDKLAAAYRGGNPQGDKTVNTLADQLEADAGYVEAFGLRDGAKVAAHLMSAATELRLKDRRIAELEERIRADQQWLAEHLGRTGM